ncbi:MAG: bifunctional hydroxymethylpyrimidine kinase/phosphomethylpyrimidine kinase [Candidatus Kuenenia sp.]|nr:bifunctional hydroxymethylpyrimidine kinase/phosphomethylpyrimidine kinase [Candidatus Kuenenia hertensis]
MNSHASPLFKVLTIAGSDSIGGAGIQADTKTITALGGYATTAITALTAQNTLGVYSVHAVPASFVAQQIDAVLSDTGADAVKTGMLLNKDIVGTVAAKLSYYALTSVVVDPVMLSKNGAVLLTEDAIQALTSQLFPLSSIITPNIPEAEYLSGLKIQNISDAEKVAKCLYKLGPANVLIKGGHAIDSCDMKNSNRVTDLLYNGKYFEYIEDEYLPAKHVHGTGCVYASAIAAYLAKGYDITVAVSKARKFVTRCIKKSFSPGRGYEVIDQFGALQFP